MNGKKMLWWEKGYKAIAGWAANDIIVSIPIGIINASFIPVTDPSKPEEYEKAMFKQTCVGGLIGAFPSFLIGVSLKNKPEWRITGITQMFFAGILGALFTAGLIFVDQLYKIPPPLRYTAAIASPTALLLGKVIRPVSDKKLLGV